MRLHPGDRLGQYQVLELLGEGGMGTVYRAHDSRLERDVAIKIIRAALAADPERIGRFVREARLLASLNHPHVATIHDLEEIHETRFLVMELVEGVTLSDRLRAGAFPVREALTLAVQIVEAIEAAHDRNIIHRDLKPANIKLTPSGSIKVLDFGLAKALAINPAVSALAQSPTITADDTGVGVILGTAAYMSPEQARGREVDKRTDVLAFGCVLFDMLAGKAAFAGDTVSDTLAAILTRDPDWSLLPPDLPRSVTRLLRRCFEKDVNRRLRDIGDARFDLEEAIALTSDSGRLLADQPQAPTAQAMPIRRPSLLVLAGLVAGALVGAVSIAALNRQAQGAPQRQIVRFALTLPEDQRVAALDFEALAISPTDDDIAYVGTQNGRQQLYVRALSALEPKPLRGTDGALEPFFSPDGKWIGFFADGKLKKVPVSEGPVREIAEAEIGFGGAWAPDGTIIFAPSNASGLMRVSAEGGPVQPVTTLDTVRGEFSHRWPALLPDGKTVLFAIGTVGTWDDAAIASKRIDKSDRPRVLMQGGTYPRYLSTGQLLYAHGGAIHAVPLAASGDVSGTSVKFQPDVLQSADGAAQFAISPRGSTIHVPGGGAANDRTLVWVDRNGNVEPLAAPPQPYTSLRLSPDGRTLAATLAGTPEQIWTYAIADNRLTQFTYDGGSAPAWSGDGSRIFFSAAREGPAALFVRRTNTNVEQRLSRSEHVDAPQSVSPDGALLFVRIDPDSGRDIWVLSPDGTARPLIATPANESSAVFSPDGQWLAFVSDETGRPEVFIARRTDPQRRVQVSKAGGTEPVWRKDGSELFFRSGNRMMSAGVRGRPMVSLSPPRQLFEAPFEKGPSYAAAYDVSTDGMRFLMIRPADTDRLGREMRIMLARTDDSGR
jgi:serine/threonine-protein kinase